MWCNRIASKRSSVFDLTLSKTLKRFSILNLSIIYDGAAYYFYLVSNDGLYLQLISIKIISVLILLIEVQLLE